MITIHLNTFWVGFVSCIVLEIAVLIGISVYQHIKKGRK